MNLLAPEFRANPYPFFAEHGHQPTLTQVELPPGGAEPRPEEERPREGARVEEPPKERAPRLDWAGLLRREFALEVFRCVRCGGRRRVLAYLTSSAGVRAIVEHQGLPSRPAQGATARGPPPSAWY